MLIIQFLGDLEQVLIFLFFDIFIREKEKGSEVLHIMEVEFNETLKLPHLSQPSFR